MIPSERGETILETAVRYFIETGLPITSEHLYEAYDFGIKPAMIRIELGALSDAGYFFQTHPSGGRYPTDKAYEFYVNRVRANALAARAKTPRAIAQEFAAGEMQGFVDGVSNYLDAWTLGLSGEGAHAGRIYSSHLSSLLSRLGVSDTDELVSIVRDCELLPERIRSSRSAPNGAPQVFIGKSPFTESEHLSVIAGSFPGGEFSLFVVGPKRMDYEKSISIFNLLNDPTNRNQP